MIDGTLLKPLVLTELQPPMNITLVTPTSGLPELSSFIAKKLAERGMFGLDTETNWCNEFSSRKVRTIQVGDKNQQFVIDLLAFAGSTDTLCKQGNFRMLDCFKPIFDILIPALCSNLCLKVGQNLSFEYCVLFWSFGVRIWHLYSTDLAERVIQAGRISLKKMAEFSMQQIVDRRFGLWIDKQEQDKFDLESPLRPEQIAYAAFDTRMPLSMREHQINEMTQEQLLATAQIENDALGSYTDMHIYGLRLDCERWMKRIKNVEERRKGELSTLDQDFVKVVGHKNKQINFEEMNRREIKWREGFEESTPEELAIAEQIRATRDNAQKAILRASMDLLTKARKELKEEARKQYSELSKAHTEWKRKVEKCEGEAYLNYASPPQLLEALKKIRGLGTLTSVDDDHLLAFNDRPMIQVLRKYRKGKKDTGTYGEQWAKTWVTKPCTDEGWIHPMDGRIHATWNQLEAETGRSSSQKPSVMNLPREEEVRFSFICDPPNEDIRISTCCEELADYTPGPYVGTSYTCPKCHLPCETKAEEYVIVTIDMSGAELRIIAELAGAKSWIMAFAKGWDVHSVSTEILEPQKWPEATVKSLVKEKWTLEDSKTEKIPQFKDDGSPLMKEGKHVHVGPCAYYAVNAAGEQEKQKCDCPKHKKLREATKAINFMLCYGGGPDALADELDITKDDAIKLMKKHELAFPDVWQYLKESGERAQKLQEARDLYGRRRCLPPPDWESSKEYYKDKHADRLELDEEVQKQNIFNFMAAYLRKPDAEEKYKLTHREPNDYEIRSAMKGLWGSIGRRGKNHCIQGSNASIIKRAMGCGFDKDGKPYLWHTLPQFYAKLLSMIHDELLIQCPKRFGKQVADLVADAFKRAAAEVMSQVVMESDHHISTHWQK